MKLWTLIARAVRHFNSIQSYCEILKSKRLLALKLLTIHRQGYRVVDLRCLIGGCRRMKKMSALVLGENPFGSRFNCSPVCLRLSNWDRRTYRHTNIDRCALVLEAERSASIWIRPRSPRTHHEPRLRSTEMANWSRYSAPRGADRSLLGSPRWSIDLDRSSANDHCAANSTRPVDRRWSPCRWSTLACPPGDWERNWTALSMVWLCERDEFH